MSFLAQGVPRKNIKARTIITGTKTDKQNNKSKKETTRTCLTMIADATTNYDN